MNFMTQPIDPWANAPNEYLTVDIEAAVEDEPRPALARWLQSHLQTNLIQLTKRVGGGGGYKSELYFADTDIGALVVRVPHPGTGWSARLLGCPEYHCIAGAYAIAELKKLNQPVPELLAIERDATILGRPFAVLRRMPGVYMHDYCEAWSRWPYPEEEWGEFLRACHSIEPVRGAGPVDDDGVGCCASWREFISQLLAARAAEHAALLPADFAPRWQRLLIRYAPLLDARPVRLLQLESNGYCNLLLDPTSHRLNAVLDFEEVTAGDPFFELVTMAWYLGRRGLADHGGRTCFSWPRFSRAYGKVAWSHPLLPLYRTIILLEKLYREAAPRARRLRAILCREERAAFQASGG